MTTFTKYIFPAILVFLGGLLSVFLTSKMNRDDWKERVNYEQQVKLFEQRLQLIDRTTAITGKMPSANDLFNLYFSNLTDTIKKNKLDKDQQIALADKLGTIRAELRSVMFLNQIYFGDSTKSKIQKYLIAEQQDTWWNLPESNYNDIVETMAKELKANQITKSDNLQTIIQPMTDTEKIIWTALTTLIGGIIIYVVGRAVEKFILDPLQEYRKTLANISDTLIYYANIYSNTTVSSKDKIDETSKALRKLASELSAKTHQIVFYRFFSKIGWIPSYNNSMDAVSTIIGFSNSLWHSDFKEIDDKCKKVEQLLNIKI
jgi:hypothetical protein